MKADLKTKVKIKNFRQFEAHEHVGIDLITSKDFDCPFSKPEVIKIKTKVNIEAKKEPFEDFEGHGQLLKIQSIGIFEQVSWDETSSDSKLLSTKSVINQGSGWGQPRCVKTGGAWGTLVPPDFAK